MNETDLEKLDGITNGTAAANKAVVLDGSLDIATINSLTATTLVGALTGNADTATVGTTVTITDNESTNEENPVVFVAGADPDGGNLGLETDGTCTYNPSTGVITTTGFAGALTGAVTGNADTCTTASAGDAAVDFFGAGVDAVTDATTCTDIEGTLLSITAGTLNAVEAQDLDDVVTLDGALADNLLMTFAAVNNSDGAEGLILPQAADVSAGIAEGQIGWDSDNDKLYIGDGAAVVEIAAGGSQDIDSVLTEGGAVTDNLLMTFAAVNNSDGAEGLILPQAADVSAGIAEGQIGWDSDNDKLYIGDGAAVVEIAAGSSDTTIYAATTDTSLLATDTLTVSKTIERVVGNGGAVTLTDTPTIADGSDGQMIIIQGTSDTNTVTFQDEAQAANTGLQLAGGQDMTLGLGDTLQLYYDSGDDNWYEVSRSDN